MAVKNKNNNQHCLKRLAILFPVHQHCMLFVVTLLRQLRPLVQASMVMMAAPVRSVWLCNSVLFFCVSRSTKSDET